MSRNQQNKRDTRERPKKPVFQTVKAAAADLGMPYTSLRDLMLRGFIRRVRLGNSRRDYVLSEDIERLAKQSVVTE